MRIKVRLCARNVLSESEFVIEGLKRGTLITMNVSEVTFEGQRINEHDINLPLRTDNTGETLPVMIWNGTVGKKDAEYYFKEGSSDQLSMGKFYKGICEFYVFKNNLYYIFGDLGLYDSDEKALFVKEYYYKQSAKFENLQKQTRLFEKMGKMEIATSREPIPEEVRFAVWRRDEGKCVKCGSKEKLEFDHIIPVSKGGSNTERNLQILCENCNRTKSASV